MGLALSPSAWAQPVLGPCMEAVVAPPETRGSGPAAYLSLISTSSASHSGGLLSFSAPMAQSSDVGRPSSACRPQGYSWPSLSSSESDEELSSELESSLDVVSYLRGEWVRAGVPARCYSAAVGTRLCCCKLKNVLQSLSPPVFYSETSSTH